VPADPSTFIFGGRHTFRFGRVGVICVESPTGNQHLFGLIPMGDFIDCCLFFCACCVCSLGVCVFMCVCVCMCVCVYGLWIEFKWDGGLAKAIEEFCEQ
jgi:hypothetical protein